MPQIQIGKQPVTQITIIEAEPEKQAEALSIMTERARFMARQPGCISISLHRSLDGRRIVNYVQWDAGPGPCWPGRWASGSSSSGTRARPGWG